MRIGIIGVGEVGGTLARLWARAGHEILLSARRPERLASLAGELSPHASIGSVTDAAAFGTDAVLLAVNYWTLDEALASIGGGLDGRVVVDATNPLAWANGRVGGRLIRLIPEGALAGQVMAARLPAARIAKAFTTPNARAIGALASNPRGKPIAGPLAADDSAAKRVAATLVRDAGLVPLDLGGLADSGPLDPGAPHWWPAGVAGRL